MIDDLTDLYAHVSTPIVLRGALKGWPPFEWSMEHIANTFANRKLPFRIAERRRVEGNPTWESKCAVVEACVHEFLAWCEAPADEIERETKRRRLHDSAAETESLSAECNDKPSSSSSRSELAECVVQLGNTGGNDEKRRREDNPLSGFSPQECFAYASYLYLRDLFPNDAETLRQFDWSVLGLPNRDGRQTTMWLGSAGANTPCHRDAYGWNTVAQLRGTKRWTLFAPADSASLYATRVPFEETSTYSLVNVARPDLRRFPRFADARPFSTDLRAGDVLIVPARWWHFVESLDSPTLSVNTWTELPLLDRVQRCDEALAKFAVNTILRSCGTLFADDSDTTAHDVEVGSDSSSDAESIVLRDSSPKVDVETILNPNEHIESTDTLLSYIRSAFKECTGSRDAQSTSASQSVDAELKTANEESEVHTSRTETGPISLNELGKRFLVEPLGPSNFADWLSALGSVPKQVPANAGEPRTHQVYPACEESSSVDEDNNLIVDLVFAFTHESVIERVRELINERRTMRSSLLL